MSTNHMAGVPRFEPESLQQAAQRCGVTVRTMRRWVVEGRLTGYRLGSTLIRLDRAEVDALLTPIHTATS